MSITLAASLVFCLLADKKGDFPEQFQVAVSLATVGVEAGTGVVIGHDKSGFYVLTAAHCVSDQDRASVRTFVRHKTVNGALDDGHIYSKSARVVARANDEDLALLRVVERDKLPDELHVCPLDNIPTSPVRVLTVGCNKGMPDCFVDEVKEREVVLQKLGFRPTLYWEATIRPVHGRSGGPIIDREKRVLGICCAAHKDNGVWKGYYCHTLEIHRFLKRNQFKWLLEGEPTEKSVR